MSLSSRIRLEPSNGLLAGLTLASVGGFVLGIATILVRLDSGQSIWMPTMLLIGLLLAAIASRNSFKQLTRPSSLRILEEGLIKFDTYREPDAIKTSQSPRLATMQDETSPYQLVAGSLIWPALYVLRLQPVPIHPSMDQQNKPVISVVIFKHQLSESNRRALARLLIWAQRKTQGNNAAASAPHSLSTVN